jgi:hypothetical protein
MNAVKKRKILLCRESRYIFPISKRLRVHSYYSINYCVQSPQEMEAKILKQNSAGEVLCISKNRTAHRPYLNVQVHKIQRLSRSDRKIYCCLQNNEFCLSSLTCSVYLASDVSMFRELVLRVVTPFASSPICVLLPIPKGKTEAINN